MRLLKITALMVMLSGTAAFAQVTTPVTKAARQGMIRGTAVDVKSQPIPNATVRLRNLKTNKVEQQAVANQTGESSFVAQAQLRYVVEVVDQAGRVIAVSDVITAEVGAVAHAVVSVPAAVPALAGVLGETAGALVSSVSGIGVTSTPLAPASPEQ